MASFHWQPSNHQVTELLDRKIALESTDIHMSPYGACIRVSIPSTMPVTASPTGYVTEEIFVQWLDEFVEFISDAACMDARTILVLLEQ